MTPNEAQILAKIGLFMEELEDLQREHAQLKQRFWNHHHYRGGWQKGRVKVEVDEWSK